MKRKFTHTMIVGLMSAALIGGNVPVMADTLPGEDAAAAASGTNEELPEGQEDPGTESTTGDPAADDPGAGPSEEDPSGTEPADTAPEEGDPSGEETAPSDEGETQPEGEDRTQPEDEGGTQEPENGDDPSKEDGTEDEEKSGGRDGEEKSEEKDKEDQTESKDKSSDKKIKDKKKKSQKEDAAAEETEEEPPVLTEEQRHPAVPRRITLYSVRNFQKIEKTMIICKAEEASVREYPDASSDDVIAAKLAKGAAVRLIDSTDPVWWFIETRDINGRIIRGYAESGSFKMARTKNVKEDPAKVTAVKITNNGFGAVEKTTYDELAMDDDLSGTRKDLVNYALQFLGTPYAEGGSSLTEGTDCAGLARAVYAEFGIALPGTLSEQYDSGKKLPVKKAKPGDLIFYINDTGAEEIMICLTAKEDGLIQVIRVSPETGRIVVDALDRSVMSRARTFDALETAGSSSDVEILDLNEWTWVGTSRISSYCYECNTPANSSITASGIPASEWHTVAVDSSVIPLGAKVYIEGYGVFVAEDTGVKGKWCDLYVYHHECSVWDMAQVYYMP